jgi:(4S)-4-hydroxy-5-phosphonooxypentane-2,3-dione isomerase
MTLDISHKAIGCFFLWIPAWFDFLACRSGDSKKCQYRRNPAMYVTLVHVQVKPAYIEDFITATRLNHEASIQEPGNRRFDVLQSSEKPGQFILYESYASAEAAAAHKETAHYLAWRDIVAEWMAQPRQGIRYDGLFPQA